MTTIQHYHFRMYKPFGIVSQFGSNNPKELRKKIFLTELYGFPSGTMPIGRLDEKSEGLLLLTTNGKLSDVINRSGVEKEYYVQLDGDITENAIASLRKGVKIGLDGEKYKTRQSVVKKMEETPTLTAADPKNRAGRHRPSSWISITITEGKFRQIRKMTAAVGFPTLRLVRMRVGTIHLGHLTPGMVEPIVDLGINKP